MGDTAPGNAPATLSTFSPTNVEGRLSECGRAALKQSSAGPGTQNCELGDSNRVRTDRTSAGTSLVSDQSNSTGIQLGAEMLVDRACLGVGWNAGNGVVLGSPLRPHVNATSVIV